MTETKTEEKKAPGLLDDVVVLKPENAIAKTRKYLCGIRKTEELKRFEFQIGVGPATFCTETFAWSGQGETAKQIFHEGAIYALSDAQVKEVKDRLQYRYLRKVFGKDKDGNLFICGVQDVDASDGGDYAAYYDHGSLKVGDRRPPVRKADRLMPGDLPLKDLLLFEQVYDNPKLGGRTLTVEDLKRMLVEAEEDERRLLEGDDAVFEGGKGGKREKKIPAGVAADRDPKIAHDLSTATAKRKSEGGFLPD